MSKLDEYKFEVDKTASWQNVVAPEAFLAVADEIQTFDLLLLVVGQSAPLIQHPSLIKPWTTLGAHVIKIFAPVIYEFP
jgi:hypothetical protein